MAAIKHSCCKKVGIGNLNGWLKVLITVIAIVIITGFTWYMFYSIRPCKYEYHVSTSSVNSQELLVSIKISNLHSRNYIELYKGQIETTTQTCEDDSGKSTSFYEKYGIVHISLDKEDTSITFNYKTKIGTPQKHGHRGAQYSDLLTFDGEQVFIFPIDASYEDEKNIRQNIDSIYIAYNVPEDWSYIIPFDHASTNETKSHVTRIDKPTWLNIYDLKTSCYAFGKFDKLEYKKNNKTFTIYVDNVVKHTFTEQTAKAVNDLYNYYSDLFNYKIPSFSLAILRKDPTDNIYLIGGSSAQTLGTTFDPNNKRDWELMGHRLFHAFFESKVSHTAFHTPPTLWFYEGLATYYENVSMGSLPQEITNKLGIDTRGNFSTLFNTYAYMRYKDSNLLSIIPMNEEQIQKSGGETEFLHYTQAPLIVKAIEERSYAINKKKNNMLNYVLDKCVGKINKKIDVKSIIMSALGEETDSFSKAYLYGNNVLPLWGLSENKKEDPELVVKSLKDMEYTLWSWFSKDNTSYLKDDITLNNILQYYDLAEKANVHFTSVEVEEKIKTESPTIYFLLKQYAFRAYICGVNLNDRDARIKLLGDKINIDKWNAVLKMR